MRLDGNKAASYSWECMTQYNGTNQVEKQQIRKHAHIQEAESQGYKRLSCLFKSPFQQTYKQSKKKKKKASNINSLFMSLFNRAFTVLTTFRGKWKS